MYLDFSWEYLFEDSCIDADTNKKILLFALLKNYNKRTVINI